MGRLNIQTVKRSISTIYQRIVYLSRQGSHFSLYYLVGAKKSAIFRQSSDMSKLRAVKCWNHGICWLDEFWLVVRVPGLIQQNWTLDICQTLYFFGKKPLIFIWSKYCLYWWREYFHPLTCWLVIVWTIWTCGPLSSMVSVRQLRETLNWLFF